jgi:hypothetical protein
MHAKPMCLKMQEHAYFCKPAEIKGAHVLTYAGQVTTESTRFSRAEHACTVQAAAAWVCA